MNRLRLDFTIIDWEGRKNFLDEYLQRISFDPTPEELETMGNYLLWGKASTKENSDSPPLTSNTTPTFNKKDTIAAKSGIEIKTSHGTWDSKEKAESLDALTESPTFNEVTFTNYPIHYTNPKATFNRAAARKNAPPSILRILEGLWEEIDRLELTLNFYDLRVGKRKLPPRDSLLEKFSEEEKEKLQERALNINPYQYLKKRHELVELRKQQFTYRDYYAPALLPSSYNARPREQETLAWDCDVRIAPLGLLYKGLEISSLIFRENYDPAQYTEEELRVISDYYWGKTKELNEKTNQLTLSFTELEDTYQIISRIYELEESAARHKINRNVENTNRALLDTLYFYIEMAELSEVQREILRLKIEGRKNQDIAQHINEEYGKNYTMNYISTIFKQKIIRKINEAAQYHFEVIGNLFFPENFRKCNFCKRVLLLHSRNFVKKSKSTTGFNSKCKRCEKERRDRKKEAQK